MAVGAALFGNTSSRSQSKNLVECKAGKMTLKGKMVHPDKRKGLLYVYQSDDSLMHFCWKDRTTGTVEDDLIIFPDDCEFKRVTQCTTGRVYVLKFKSSSRKFFFWVQEPKTDKDEENCRRINEVLNNPPTPGSARSGGATPDGGDLQNLLNNMSQQQLMQLFGGVGQIGGLSSLLGTMSRPSTSQSGRSGASASTTAATATTSSSTSSVASAGSTDTKTSTTAATTEPKTTSTTTTTTTSSSAAAVTTTTVATSAPTTTTAAPTSTSSGGQPAIQLSDLQNFLSGLSVPQAGGQGSGVDLAQAITTDNLSTVLVEPGLAEALQQHLPAVAAIAGSGAGQTASDQLRSTLSSPQFQQSGQLGPVMQQLEVGPEAVDAANQGNMEEFVRALQRASLGSQPDTPQSPTSGGGEEKRPKRDGDNSGKKPDEDDDEGMSMD